MWLAGARPCGYLWAVVRKQEGGCQGQEWSGHSLSLVLQALLSRLHSACLARGLPAALVPAGLVGSCSTPFTRPTKGGARKCVLT